MTYTFQISFMSSFLVIYCWKVKYSPPNFCLLKSAILSDHYQIGYYSSLSFPIFCSECIPIPLTSFCLILYYPNCSLNFQFHLLYTRNIILKDTSLKHQFQQSFGVEGCLPQWEQAIVTLRSMGIPFSPHISVSVNK